MAKISLKFSAIFLFLLFLILVSCSEHDYFDIHTIKQDLRNENWSIRIKAVNALDYIGPTDEVLDLLIETLGDNNVMVRMHVESVLAGMGPAAHKALPRLIEALADDDDSVRLTAVLALGNIGPAQEVVPPLIKMLDDKVFYVRSATVDALEKIGKEAVSALPKLKELANNDQYLDTKTGDYPVRKRAERAIESIEYH